MNYREYIKDLENPKKVYLFYGLEKFLIEFLVKETKKKFVREGFETMDYSYIDGEKTDLNTIINANETLPIMSEKKVVIVEDFTLLTKKNKVNEIEEDRLIEYIKDSNSLSILIFIINEEKIDGRRRVFKEFKNYANIIELNRLSESELVLWIKKQVKNSNRTIKETTIRKIIENTGYFEKDSETDLLYLQNEIKKLIDYTDINEEITEKNIEEVVTKSLQSNIFHLIDNIAEKNLTKSIHYLENMLASDEAVIYILNMLFYRFKMIYLTKLYMNKGYTQDIIMNKIGVRHSFLMKKFVHSSKKFSVKNLEDIIIKCSDLDLDIKLGKIEEILGIEKLIVEIQK